MFKIFKRATQFLCLLCINQVYARHLGAWYFVANGLSTVPNHVDPSWLSQSINFASLAFISPAEIVSKGVDALPQAFINHTTNLQGQGIPVVFSIGGAAFANSWNFLSSQQSTIQVATVCAQWAKTYNVGIEIDYEGNAAENGFTMSGNGTVILQSEMENLVRFVETFRKMIPMGSKTQTLSLDVYASQGGGPGLTYLINRFVPGMPTVNPTWVKQGENRFVLPGLDWVNIMVAGGDAGSDMISYVKGYVGETALVSTEWNPARINAPVPPERVRISMIASHHCGQTIDPDLETVLTFITNDSTYRLDGLMFWAVAPFGCGGKDSDPQLTIGDWNCENNNACPAFRQALQRINQVNK